VKDYLQTLNDYLDKADAMCGMEPLKSISEKNRADQLSACKSLRTRHINLEYYPMTEPQPPPEPPIVAPAKDCDVEKAGSVLDPHSNNCICQNGKDGTIQEDGKDKPACVPSEADNTGKDDKKIECNADEHKNVDKSGNVDSANPCDANCGWWCRNKTWVIAGGVGLGILGLILFLNRGHGNSTTTQTPYDPCPPAVLVGSVSCLPRTVMTPAPSVQPPPPIVAPTVVIVAPVPKPVATTTSESTSGTSSSTASGVRHQTHH